MLAAVLVGCGKPRLPRTALSEAESRQFVTAAYCDLPELQVVTGWREVHVPMGGLTQIEFRLPSTKEPEQWLREIAERSSATSGVSCKVMAKFKIGTSEQCYLEYDPETALFRLYDFWD